MEAKQTSDFEEREEPVAKVDCKQSLVKAIRFNSDGQYAMTCGSDRTIKLWQASNLLELECYKGHSAEVVDCQAKQDNSQFCSASQDKSVIVWDVETGKLLRRFRNMAPFTTICYGPDFRTVLAGSADGTVKIFDLRALNAHDPIQTLTEAEDSITCCRVARGLIFTTSLDKNLRTYDVRAGKLSIDCLGTQLNHISASNNADTLLVSCLRKSAVLINRKEAKVLNEFVGNENKLFRLESAFAMKDTMVVAGSEDGRVYLWDVSSRQPKLALKHTNVSPPIIQSISCDTLDHLLTACANYIYLWSI